MIEKLYCKFLSHYKTPDEIDSALEQALRKKLEIFIFLNRVELIFGEIQVFSDPYLPGINRGKEEITFEKLKKNYGYLIMNLSEEKFYRIFPDLSNDEKCLMEFHNIFKFDFKINCVINRKKELTRYFLNFFQKFPFDGRESINC